MTPLFRQFARTPVIRVTVNDRRPGDHGSTLDCSSIDGSNSSRTCAETEPRKTEIERVSGTSPAKRDAHNAAVTSAGPIWGAKPGCNLTKH